MNKQEIQISFVNALKAMDEIKSQEEVNKEKVKEVFDIISSKIKEYANRKRWWHIDYKAPQLEQQYSEEFARQMSMTDEEFKRQLGMTDEEWDEWWSTEYDIAELDKIQTE